MSSAATSKNPKNVYHIGGIQVEFPYQPYGTQLAFMCRVISTLDRAKRDGHCHALLESPTGTGKTLSLLCSTLAWQQSYKSKNCSPSKPAPEAFTDPLGHGGGFIPESQSPSVLLSGKSGAAQSESNDKTAKTPTIYYASRTHSQISQVIREYKKTSYRVPMAVLASRKQYCTNPLVNRKDNLDEECKLLLRNKDEGCLQFKNMHKVKGHPSVQKGGCHEAHDIEDLLKVGHIVKGCAYYAARAMSDFAELVFCPYSYIINPVVRGAMDVNITGAIIILDEAHNMEDIARDAGSVDIEEDVLLKLQTELVQLCSIDAMAYQPLREMVEGLVEWMDMRKDGLEKREFQHYLSCWTGSEASKQLQEANISQQCFPILLECATKAIKVATDLESDVPHLSGMSVITLEGLFSSLTYFFSRNGSHILDYQLALRRYVKRDSKNGSSNWTCSLSLWCMNPSVVFRDIADLSLSIILTSGTLSPMNSFSSELGVQFETCLEAPHVIDVEAQMWTAVISNGPGNYPLNASYKTADAYEFQDALGKSLEEICKIVPGGSLLFFPSYKLMGKLCNRWRETGQWSRLNMRKTLFVEPRGGNQEEFETTLKGYYDSVCGQSKPPNGRKKRVKATDSNATVSSEISKNGAALLAVCRGKVSEGIDFSDDNARVVIVVGIPFPNINDIQVELKKRYNDTYRSSKNLLNGSQWYCQQAFRALNQAIGRCIRHRNDYGAIILLDTRFQEERNRVYISKWLRKSIRQYESFDKSLEGLRSFFGEVKNQVGKDRAGNISNSDMENISSTKQSNGLTKKKTSKPNQFCNELHSAKEFDACYPQQRLQCAVAVQACVQADESKNRCRESIDIECCFPSDSRCLETLPTTFSSEEPEISMVRETPSVDGGVSSTSPASLSKNGNSSSNITQAFTESPNQFLFCPVASTSLDKDPSRDESVMTVTPQKDFTENTCSLIPGTESSYNLSVSSHTQKRRKTMVSPVIDVSDDELSDTPNAQVAGCSSFKRNLEIFRDSSRRIEFGFETCSAEHQSRKMNDSQSLAVDTNVVKYTVMDKRLKISCSLCRSPIGLPDNNLYVSCSVTSTSKVHLISLLKERAELGDSDVLTIIPVLITDTSSVDPRLFNRALGDTTGRDIWCKEDGCVFSNIICPFCSCPKNCLGVRVLATDAANVQLLNKMLFYLDHLEIKDTEASKNKAPNNNKELFPANGSATDEIANLDSIEKFSYAPKHQDLGNSGWRTTKSKMRLPKIRQLSSDES
ncbi:hypothetical protein SLA2020_316950 [Shorea laevis]